MKVTIYTDGSHLDKLNNGRLGCGGVMIDSSGTGYGTVLEEFSEELTPDYMKKEFKTDNCSNPTAEMMGLLVALTKFNIPANVSEVEIFADYTGVSCWMTGKWATKEPYIKEIKRRIEDVIEKKNLKGKITYHWVKAHQAKGVGGKDAYWNSYVDLLAKGQK